MKTILFLLVTGLILPGCNLKGKPFPPLHAWSSDGKEFTNENFNGKNTIVALFYLECPQAMELLKDIETIQADPQHPIQFVGILENTNEQITQFNDTLSNAWSDLRAYFKLKPVPFTLIGECAAENVKLDKYGNNDIGPQCRILTKKFKTITSPTLVYVDKSGIITQIKKGYKNEETTRENRLAYLLHQ